MTTTYAPTHYLWEVSSEPDDVLLTDPPSWLLTQPPRAPSANGAVHRGEIPTIGRAALEFIAFGAPKGSQRVTALAAARNLLAAGKTVEDTAALIWQGLQGSPVGEPDNPWTEQEARAIAASIASSPAPPPRPLTPELRIRPNGSGAATIGAPEMDSSGTPVVADESVLRFRTAREIGEQTVAAVEWNARPWVARGAITEIDGKIKQSGKTTWLTHLCRAVLDGADFMGEPTRRSPVVYLTEQTATSFRQALARARLLDRDDFHVLVYTDTVGTSWPDVVALAAAKCRQVGAELLAVDTLPQFAGIKGDAENNAGAALEAMGPLQMAVADGSLGIACTRHDRKSGGDVGDSARGSSAFGGAVDIVLQLQRGEGNTRPTIRVIRGLSRFDGTPDTLAIELTEDGYVALGSESAVALHEAKAKLLDVAPGSEQAAKTIDELLEGVSGVKRTIAYDAAKVLLEWGELQRIGKGKRGDPHRYWRPEIHPSVYREEVADESLPSRESDGPPAAGEDRSNGHAPPTHSSATIPLRADERIGPGECVHCGRPALEHGPGVFHPFLPGEAAS